MSQTVSFLVILVVLGNELRSTNALMLPVAFFSSEGYTMVCITPALSRMSKGRFGFLNSDVASAATARSFSEGS